MFKNFIRIIYLIDQDFSVWGLTKFPIPIKMFFNLILKI